MDNSKIFIIFFIIFFFVFGRGLDFVVSGFNNINEQSQRVSKESVATDFYHSVNYGLNTINFELDNLVSNINTETKSTLDDIEIILTSITRRTNFVTTKESLALVSVPNFNFNITEQFAVTWYRTVSGLFKVNSLQFTVDSKSEELATLETTTTSGSLSLTGQATTQNSTVREIVKETVVERVIQASGITLEDLQKLNNELRSEIYKISANTGSQINNVYQVVSATNKIDNLGGVTIYDSNITNSNISGTNSSFTNSTVETLTITGATNLSGALTGTTGAFTGNLSTAGQLSITGTATSTATGDFAFDTNTLYIDSINNRVGVGSTTPSDSLSVNGATYLAPISAPSVTTDRLYNISNDLYWGGNLLSGSAVGNWTSNGTDIWRPSGNVGIGTTSPYTKLAVDGTFRAGTTTINGLISQTGLGGSTYLGEGAGINDDLVNRKNAGFGYQSIYSNTSGNQLTAIGYRSLYSNTTGLNNTANGYSTLYSNTDGYDNTASGAFSLYSNTTAGANVATGYASMYYNTTGEQNTATGYYSLYHNITGSNNSAFGIDAGRFIANGTTENTTVDYNVFIGPQTKALADNDQNEIVIGYNATGVGSNSVVLGADTITKTILKGNVGIGTTSPFAKLSVKGAGTTTGVNFQTTNSNDTPLVTVLDSGNVGIGTASPGAKLDVVVATTQALRVERGNGGTIGQFVGSGYSTTLDIQDNVGSVLLLKSGSGDILGLSANSATPHLAITTTGNVGIGTTSPFRKLSVEGSVWISGDLTISGLTSTSTISATAFNSTDTVNGGYSIGGNKILYASSANHSTLVGMGAGNSMLSGNQNTALGYQSLFSADTTNSNTATGYQAGYSQTGGNNNSYFGFQSGYDNISGGENSYFGTHAGYGNTTGSNNTVLGNYANEFSTTGSDNVVAGYAANYYNQSATSTVAIGSMAGMGVFGQSYNQNGVFIGYQAGYGLTTGNNNLLLGYKVGDNLTTGSSNIVIGYDIDSPTATNSNTLNIGNLIFGTGIDGAGTTLSSGNIGIGTTSPFAKLSVNQDVGDVGFAVGSSTATNFIVDKYGRVGIGTNSPAYKLDVNGTANFSGAVTGIALNEIEDLEVDKVFTMANKVLTWRFTNPAGGMMWDWTGNATGHLFELNQNTGNPGAGTHLAHIQAEDNDILLMHLVHTGTPTPGYFSIDSTNDSSSAGDIFFVNSARNVGIGTTSPFAKLSVVGDVVADYFNATSTTATSTFAGGIRLSTSGRGLEFPDGTIQNL